MFNNYERLISKETKLSVIGMGYVGLPIAIAFDQKIEVIGFDISEEKIDQLKNNIDVTEEVGSEKLKECQILFTNDEKDISKATVHIVAVPTPIKSDTTPDLRPLEKASLIIGRNLVRGSIVVFESTVYPGVTEDICVPILEKESGLIYGVDFKVGYSPERINPGDKIHRLETITKVVSGMDEESLTIISQIYDMVVDAGIFKAKSIKVAEAAKVIENAQRDINIAFMNELSMIFDRLDINTSDVLEAAGTKWNFLNFTPGLVGGHCIGVDPYYLTYKARQLGYESKIINNGRTINDGVGKYIAQKAVKLMLKSGLDISNASVGILGFTFKENCPDIRNTKVIDIVRELKDFGIQPSLYDPLADPKEVKRHYQIELKKSQKGNKFNLIIVAVAHDEYIGFDSIKINSLFKKGSPKIIMDIKSVMKNVSDEYIYWSL